MQVLIVLVILIVVAGVIFLMQNLNSGFAQRLEQADIAIKKQDFTTAKTILENIIAENPDIIEAHYKLACIFQDSSSTGSAILEFRQCLKLLNKATKELVYSEEQIRKHLLEIYQTTSKDKEAYDECQILKSLNPENASYPFYMAELLIKGGDTGDKALNLLETTRELDDKLNHLDFLYGFYWYNKKENEKAKQYFIEAINAKPDDLDSQFYLGEIYYHEELFQEALKMLKTCISEDRFKKTGLYLMADSLFRLKKYQEAIDFFDKALRIKPRTKTEKDQDIDSWYLKGLSFESLDDIAAALTSWDKVISLYPEHPDAKEKLKIHSAFRIDDDVRELNISPVETFRKITDKLVSLLNYHILEIIILKNGNASIIAREADGKKQTTAIYVSRNLDLADEKSISLLHSFMKDNRAAKGVFITTGEVSTKGEEVASKRSIEIINHIKLAKYLKKIPKDL